MINYNPKDWFVFIFQLSKADTFRKLLPLMIGVGIYAGIVAYLELNFLHLSETQYIRNVGMMHSVLGFVISLLLVFRTNTAYDRWWEGRKIWGGVTNSSRNLAIKLQAIATDQDDRRFFRLMVPNFAFALKCLLRENEDFRELDPVLDLKKEKHLPNQVAAAMYARLNAMYTQGKIDTAQLLVLNEELKALTIAVPASASRTRLYLILIASSSRSLFSSMS